MTLRQTHAGRDNQPQEKNRTTTIDLDTVDASRSKVPVNTGSSKAADFVAALSCANHAIYVVLFLVRSFSYTASDSSGSFDRPFYYEARFLGYLIPPGMPQLCNWDGGRYNVETVLAHFTNLLSGRSDAKSTGETRMGMEIIDYCASTPDCMWWYQFFEGTFHFMICAGALFLVGYMMKLSKFIWSPLRRLYLYGMWFEIVFMDSFYVIAYTYMGITTGIPGHYGLMLYAVLIHHATVLPDFLSVWLEWNRVFL